MDQPDKGLLRLVFREVVLSKRHHVRVASVIGLSEHSRRLVYHQERFVDV